MNDLLNLAKTREERENKERIDSNQKVADEFYKLLVEKNLQVQDAILIIKMLNDKVSHLSGIKIQQTYLNHLIENL